MLLEQRLDDANARLGALSRERLQLLDAAAANAHDGTQHANKVKSLTAELEACQRQLQEAQAAARAASPVQRGAIAQLQGQLQSTQEQLQAQRERAQKLAIDGDALRHTAAAAQAAQSAAQRQAEEAETRLGQLKAEYAELMQEQQKLASQIAALSSDNSASEAQAEIRTLRQHLRNERSVCDLLKADVQRLNEELRAAESKQGGGATTSRQGGARRSSTSSASSSAAASARSMDRARRQADAVRISNLQNTVDRLNAELALAKKNVSKWQARASSRGGHKAPRGGVRDDASSTPPARPKPSPEQAPQRSRTHSGRESAASSPPASDTGRHSMDASKRFDHMHHSNPPASTPRTPSRGGSKTPSRDSSRASSPIQVSRVEASPKPSPGHFHSPPRPAHSPAAGGVATLPAAQPLPPGAQLFKDADGNTFVAFQAMPVSGVSAPPPLTRDAMAHLFNAFSAPGSAPSSPPLRAPTRPPLKATPSSAHTGRAVDAQGEEAPPRTTRNPPASASSSPQRGASAHSPPASPPKSARVSWQPLSRTVGNIRSPGGAFVPPPSAGQAAPPGMRGAALNGGIPRARNPSTPHKLKWRTPTPVSTEETLRNAGMR